MISMKLFGTIILSVFTLLPAAGWANALADAVRGELERAQARLENLREAYDAGAISKRELEEAEAKVAEMQRRLKAATDEPRDLDVAEARSRMELARAEHEKLAAKAKKLRDLYDAGAAARNETEEAEAAAKQAEIYFRLNEELARRVAVVASMPVREPHAISGLTTATFFNLQDAYLREFGRPLPVSAFGPSETHEKLGFDHDGRVDIALHPDSDEGRWLVAQLHARSVPFIAFRQAAAGKSTGAHIHMGFPSPVVRRAS